MEKVRCSKDLIPTVMVNTAQNANFFLCQIEYWCELHGSALKRLGGRKMDFILNWQSHSLLESDLLATWNDLPMGVLFRWLLDSSTSWFICVTAISPNCLRAPQFKINGRIFHGQITSLTALRDMHTECGNSINCSRKSKEDDLSMVVSRKIFKFRLPPQKKQKTKADSTASVSYKSRQWDVEEMMSPKPVRNVDPSGISIKCMPLVFPESETCAIKDSLKTNNVRRIFPISPFLYPAFSKISWNYFSTSS